MNNVAYFNIETEEYPLFVGDLALVDVDVNNLPNHIVEVIVDEPEYDADSEHIRQTLPTQDDKGIWRANFVKVPYTEEEKKARKLFFVRQKVASNKALTTEEALLLTEV